MAEATATDGTLVAFDEDAVDFITDAHPHAAHACHLYIDGAAGYVVVAEAARALAARLHPKHSLAALRRPDGSGVWVRGAAVTLVRAPEHHEAAPGTHAVMLVAGHAQALRETPAEARAILRAHGANV